MALSKDKILKHAGVFKTAPVHVPAWADENGDDVVLVRGMTIREFEINQSRKDDGQSTASVIARCALDEKGMRLFDDADTQMIAELPLAEVQKLSEAIAQQSGIGVPEKDESVADKSIADAEGNSDAAPTDDSSSS